MKLWLPLALLGVLCLGGVLLFEESVFKGCSILVAANFLSLSSACLFQWPGIWLKRPDGRLNPLSYILLLPLHILNWLSLSLATRIGGEICAHCIAQNVWLGRRLTSQEAAALFGDSPVAVLDLTSEFPENARFRGATRYLCLPTVDHSAPTQAQLRSGADFMTANCRERIVYVHCALGHGRSATVVAAWLLRDDALLAVDEAIKRLQSVRSGVRLNGEQRMALEVFVGDYRRIT